MRSNFILGVAMSKFYRGVKIEELKVGNIYRTAIPFTVTQPLKFFQGCSECKNKKTCNTAYDDCGKAVIDPNGLNRDNVLDSEEETLSIVVPHKVRPAVLIESETYLRKGSFPYVFMAPIQTLHREGKDARYLKKLIEKNSYPTVHYIGEHTGRESVVSVSDIKRVHISMLLEPHEANPFADDILIEIYRKLGDLVGFDKGKISACQTCEMNCDNCELKKLASTPVVNG